MAELRRGQSVQGEAEPATKRERTRREVLRAARESIAENGTAGATAAEIARRCGLSWGVIQYHFGDRVGLFLALLEDGLESLTRRLDTLSTAGNEPRIRVRALIDASWSLLRSDRYRVMLDVQLQLGRFEEHRDRVREMTQQLRSRLQAQWRMALPDIPADRVDRAERLATIALRGLALERALDGSGSDPEEETECLLQCLFDVLELK